MNIVIDGRSLGQKPTGIGIYAYNFIREILNSEDHYVILTDVAESKEIKALEELGVPVVCYGKLVYRSSGVLGYFGFIRDYLRDHQPDVFWEPNILIPRKLTGYHGKVIITIHDMFPITHRQYFDWKYYPYFRLMLSKTLRYTDGITYNSLETKKETERFFPQAKKKKSFLTYIIVPKMEPSKEGSGEVEELSKVAKDFKPQGRKLEPGYFLYVGNLEKRKGVDLLLQGYAAYRKNGGTMPLVLAGKSREADVDMAICHAMAADEKILLAGYVEEDEKKVLYQHCGCFVFPSRAEGFGISVVEAMNYQKPILLSDLTIFKEIVGDVVEYFPLSQGADGLCKALATMEAKRENIEAQQKSHPEEYGAVVERYLPKHLRDKMLEALQNV
ncbi:MAG: glycosyltransferase family 4 protein [Lachnospiraceae bacterium]|nr:glycosyltransferase family 4 protein [Lachnospiraceae bacterium]